VRFDALRAASAGDRSIAVCGGIAESGGGGFDL